MWELRITNRFRPACEWIDHWFFRLCLSSISLMLIFAAGCTRTASLPSVIYATDSAPRITIDRVQINEGSGIYLSGRSTLADGECVQTRLLENQTDLEWWPRDVCVEIANGRWEFLTALGRNGAPQQLETGAEYEIYAWWPQEPEVVNTRFPFDLSGPSPSP